MMRMISSVDGNNVIEKDLGEVIGYAPTQHCTDIDNYEQLGGCHVEHMNSNGQKNCQWKIRMLQKLGGACLTRHERAMHLEAQRMTTQQRNEQKGIVMEDQRLLRTVALSILCLCMCMCVSVYKVKLS